MAGRRQRIVQLTFLLGLALPLLLSGAFSISSASRPLSVALVRVVGYSIGYDIQGHFQLIVQGPANLSHVEIRFNSTLVYNTTTAWFIWSFHTDAYPLGWTNITVMGWDANATLYQWSRLRQFVPPEVNTPYWILAIVAWVASIGLVVVIIIVRRSR